jgi:hypothetical protein
MREWHYGVQQSIVAKYGYIPFDFRFDLTTEGMQSYETYHDQNINFPEIRAHQMTAAERPIKCRRTKTTLV